MYYDKEYKKIVKYINSEKVFDIVSFMKEFGCTEEFQYNKDEIEKNFNKKEKGGKYDQLKQGASKKTKVLGDSIPMNIGGMNLDMPAYSFPYYDKEDYNINSVPATYNYNDENIYGIDYNFLKPVTISNENSIQKVKAFMSIWQDLKSKGYVIEISNKLKKDKKSYFLKSVSQNIHNEKEKEKENFKTEVSFSNKELENFLTDCRGYKANLPPKYNAKEFSSKIVVENTELIELCKDFMDYKIIPTHKLTEFIKNKFQTEEQLQNKKSMCIAIVAVILSLIGIGYNIFKDFLNQKDTNNINTNVEKIINYLEDNKQDNDENNIEEYLKQILEKLSSTNPSNTQP